MNFKLTFAPMALPNVSSACALAVALAKMAEASPLASLTCSILTASEANILLCLNPSALFIADSLIPLHNQIS